MLTAFSMFSMSLTSGGWTAGFPVQSWNQCHVAVSRLSSTCLSSPAEICPTPAELESTYLLAKNAAVEQGDQRSAGRFFIAERMWAREGRWRDL